MRVYNHYAWKDKLRIFENKCPIQLNLWPIYEDENNCEEIEYAMLEWIEDNTEFKVFCPGDMRFSFENAEDAALFKLTWS